MDYETLINSPYDVQVAASWEVLDYVLDTKKIKVNVSGGTAGKKGYLFVCNAGVWIAFPVSYASGGGWIATGSNEFTFDQNGNYTFETRTGKDFDASLKAYMWDEPSDDGNGGGKTCLLVAAGLPLAALIALRGLRSFLPLIVTEAYYRLSVFVLNSG